MGMLLDWGDNIWDADTSRGCAPVSVQPQARQACFESQSTGPAQLGFYRYAAEAQSIPADWDPRLALLESQCGR